MLKLQFVVAGLAAAFLFSSCIALDPIAPPLPSAYFYSDTKANLNCGADGENGCASQKDGKPVGTKTGEACTSAILALVQMGDMSLKAAAAKGNISNVTSVDYSNTNVLGSVYLKKCLIVNGN